MTPSNKIDLKYIADVDIKRSVNFSMLSMFSVNGERIDTELIVSGDLFEGKRSVIDRAFSAFLQTAVFFSEQKDVPQIYKVIARNTIETFQKYDGAAKIMEDGVVYPTKQ